MIIRFIYTVLLSLVAPFLLYGLFRRKSGKPSVGVRWKEHFGVAPHLSTSDSPLWIHAVSVGETIAATPLIKQIKQRYPNKTILLTTTTPTGAKQAEALSDWVEHRYMPIDYGFAVKRFIRQFQPSQLLIIETELWPNTLHQVHKSGIPVTVINARLSDKSYRGYHRVLPLFRQMVPSLTKVLCQYQDDADRFEKLGVPSSNLIVTGSIKFDIEISPETTQKSLELRTFLSKERPIWIAASTHQGEDEIILSAHQKLLTSIPNALLILVPRHPERFESVEAIAKATFETVTRTGGQSIHASTNVYLGNTMGEMLVLLGASDVCFMGGSLVGKKVGGHNLLEPAAMAKPTLIGPSYYNFKDITELLNSAEACRIVQDIDELSDSLHQLLDDTNLAKEMGKRALDIVTQSSGALEATINQLNLP